MKYAYRISFTDKKGEAKSTTLDNVALYIVRSEVESLVNKGCANIKVEVKAENAEQFDKLTDRLKYIIQSNDSKEMAKARAESERISNFDFVSKAFKEAKFVSDGELPRGWLGCTTEELYKVIKYDEFGMLPSEHNVFASENGANFWFCPDKPVGIVNKNGKVIKLANNAYERYVNYVTAKWKLRNDFVPEYKIDDDECRQEVGLALFDSKRKGLNYEEANHACFNALDARFKKHYDSIDEAICDTSRAKTVLEEENFNTFDRVLLAYLCTGDLSTLTPIIGLNGEELPMPTAEEVELNLAFERPMFNEALKIFKLAHETHDCADVDTWKCAQMHFVRVPMRSAVEAIYGVDDSTPKKFKSARTKYDKHYKDVTQWILDAVNELTEKEELDANSKWIAIANRCAKVAKAQGLFNSIEEHFGSTDSAKIKREAMRKLVLVNPDKAYELLVEMFGINANVKVEQKVAAVAGGAVVTINGESRVLADDELPF